MATRNPFDLLGDDDDGDPSRLIAAQEQKVGAKKAAATKVPAVKTQPANLPTKPLPPAQAVREARSSAATGRSHAGEASGLRGQGRGRAGRGGGRGQVGDHDGEDSGRFIGRYEPTGTGTAEGYGGKPADGGRGFYSRGGRLPYRGGRRGGYPGREAEGDEEMPQRRVFERHSGTGRGNELKRQGSGRGNWGTHADDVVTEESTERVNTTEDRDAGFQKIPEQTAGKGGAEEGAEGVKREAEAEDKEMTLEEYEKIKVERRKALLAMKPEERKVAVDRDFESMKLLSLKKGNDDALIKLGSDNEKETMDKVERAKKSVSINEFLKPAASGRYCNPRGGRGGEQGRGQEGGTDSGFLGIGGITGSFNSPGDMVIKFEDPGQFPNLGGK